MIKRNFSAMNWILEEACHGGRGAIQFRRVLQEEFDSGIAFLDYTILPPGASIGYHLHPETEEVYVVLRGTGLMTVDGEQARVGPGDVVLNRRGGSHGLENNGTVDLAILVVEGKF